MSISKSCLVCGQPLPPNTRSDKLTCSASCRTQRYRLAQRQANSRGSLSWRRQLQVVHPIQFVEVTARSLPTIRAREPDPISRPRWVPTQQWDDTLVAMNLLWQAYIALDKVIMLQHDHKWGCNGDPLTGETQGPEIDVVWALRQNQDTLYHSLTELSQLRGLLERWLAPLCVEFSQHFAQLRQQIRAVAKEAEFLSLRYEVSYPEGMKLACETFCDQLEAWWFMLNDQVDEVTTN